MGYIRVHTYTYKYICAYPCLTCFVPSCTWLAQLKAAILLLQQAARHTWSSTNNFFLRLDFLGIPPAHPALPSRRLRRSRITDLGVFVDSCRGRVPGLGARGVPCAIATFIGQLLRSRDFNDAGSSGVILLNLPLQSWTGGDSVRPPS
jgi:hypothetical protein